MCETACRWILQNRCLTSILDLGRGEMQRSAPHALAWGRHIPFKSLEVCKFKMVLYGFPRRLGPVHIHSKHWKYKSPRCFVWCPWQAGVSVVLFSTFCRGPAQCRFCLGLQSPWQSNVSSLSSSVMDWELILGRRLAIRAHSGCCKSHQAVSQGQATGVYEKSLPCA